MRAIYIPLRDEARQALVELGQREQRDPRRQGAILIEDGLRRAGLLDGKQRQTSQEPAQ